MIQAVLLLVFVTAGFCFILGAIVAVAVVIWAPDMASAVAAITNAYYLVIGLMPVTLWLGIYISNDDPEYAPAYQTRARALLTAFQGALVGSLLGAGPIFLAVVIYVPVILSKYPIETFGPAVRDSIVWTRLSLAVAAAVISAIPLGFWSYYANGGSEAD